MIVRCLNAILSIVIQSRIIKNKTRMCQHHSSFYYNSILKHRRSLIKLNYSIVIFFNKTYFRIAISSFWESGIRNTILFYLMYSMVK